MQLKIFLIMLGLIFLPLKFVRATEGLFEENTSPAKRLRKALDTPSVELDRWNTLPDELYIKIFDDFSFINLSNAQQVCKHWNRIGKDEFLSSHYLILKRPFSVLAAKIDPHEKVLARIRHEIDSCIQDISLSKSFYASPDALYKSLLTPFAVSRLLLIPERVSLLFESNIKASQIHVALKRQVLDKELQEVIENYANSMPVAFKKCNLFSQEFVDFITLASPYFKAYYLLSLLHLLSSEPFFNFLDKIFTQLDTRQAYAIENECLALYAPQAMVKLEIPSINSYNVGIFCHRWVRLSNSQAYKSQWETYEEVFLRRAALEGLSKAQVKVGWLLDKKGITDEAEGFYCQAISQGETKALFYFGDLLIKQSKYKQAEEVYRHDLIQALPKAQRMLGRVLLLQRNFKAAKKPYMQAIKQGSVEAQYEWGKFLLLQHKYYKAEELLQYAARQHHVEAQYELGRLFYERADNNKAAIWYRFAATKGHKEAQYELALLMLKYGKEQEAEQFLQLAAGQGHILACFELGYYAFKKSNMAVAEEYFYKIITQADGHILYKLSQLLSHTPDQAAFDLFQRQITTYAKPQVLNKYIEINSYTLKNYSKHL